MDEAFSRPFVSVLGIGKAVVDIILPVAEPFLEWIPGGKGGSLPVDAVTFDHILSLAGVEPKRVPGGSCANTLKGLAAMGCKASFYGHVGTDAAGDDFLADLARYGVETQAMQTEAPTGQIISLVTPDGERTQRSFLGSHKTMVADDLHAELFTNSTHVHIESYLLRNQGYVRRVMELAKQVGITISFDLGSYELVRDYKEEILFLLQKYVDVVIGNADEVRVLTEENPERACSRLNQWVTFVAVLVGKEGCWIETERGVTNIPTSTVAAIDSTGAGDAFASGFLYGFLHDYSIEESAAWGNRLGSTVVQYYGAEIPLSVWPTLQQKGLRGI